MKMKVSAKTKKAFEKFKSVFQGQTSLLIVMQDNPDPDAIAAAVALRKLVDNVAGIKSSIAHGGIVGRSENKALVKYLNLTLSECASIDFDKFDLIAMVDTQPGTGNNSLPQDREVDIIFDHHPIKKMTRSSSFYDIRARYGAASTILVEYLVLANIEIEMPLATALLYAIRSDTQDLGREACNADIEAITHLFPIANKRMLSRIQRGSVPGKYFVMLASALKNAQVYEDTIITELGDISNPDIIGEVADLLLRHDGIEWVMASGVFNDKFLISIRTNDEKKRADQAIEKIVNKIGTGGGHLTYAGAQVPLDDQKSLKDIPKIEKIVKNKFLKITGNQKTKGRRLTD